MGLSQRLELQTLLEGVLGSRNVYFQEPEDLKMQYPCIVYKLDTVRTQYAGNLPYRHGKRWAITVIDEDPDSFINDDVAKLPTASFSRRFVANDLNHTIYTIYF